MQVVDHDSMGMGMMGAVFREMRMVGGQVRMVMLQHRLIFGRPEAQDSRQPYRADDRQR